MSTTTSTKAPTTTTTTAAFESTWQEAFVLTWIGCIILLLIKEVAPPDMLLMSAVLGTLCVALAVFMLHWEL